MPVKMGILTVLWEKWVEFRRDFYKITLAAMIAPLLYILVFGLGIQTMSHGQSYLNFLIPGVVALTTMNGSFNAIAQNLNVQRLYEKAFDQVIISPTPLWQFIAGQIIGGSLGSVTVNQAVRGILPQLLKTYQVIHICGKGNLDESLIGTEGYVQYEYVDAPLKHLFASADVVISRAGANSICEILALRKPNILIPLSAAASRGDQILNANSFAKQGFSTVLEEEVLTADTLSQAIEETYKNRQQFIDKMSESHLNNAVKTIMGLIHDCTRS